MPRRQEWPSGGGRFKSSRGGAASRYSRGGPTPPPTTAVAAQETLAPPPRPRAARPPPSKSRPPRVSAWTLVLPVLARRAPALLVTSLSLSKNQRNSTRHEKMATVRAVLLVAGESRTTVPRGQIVRDPQPHRVGGRRIGRQCAHARARGKRKARANCCSLLLNPSSCSQIRSRPLPLLSPRKSIHSGAGRGPAGGRPGASAFLRSRAWWSSERPLVSRDGCASPPPSPSGCA